MNSSAEILGLFPSFTSEAVGGVQASGREAWAGIVGHVGEDRATAVQFEPGGSKAKAVWDTVVGSGKPELVLVWHLNLLKLAAFVRPGTTRLVVFLHGIESWRRQDSLTNRLLRRVSLFLTNSDHTWRQFVRCNPLCETARHRTVHLGIGKAVADGTIPARPPAVLMIGRLDSQEDYKGHRQMIAVWPRVLATVPAAQLWIAGDGDLRASLERLAVDAGVANAIRFFGRVSEGEKERLLSSARSFAMPSRGEGFGLVYLEAMRLGRPCIVSDADAGREVVNPPEAGLAVDPENQTALADAIRRMLTCDDEWRGWSVAARERYRAHFTASHFHERLVTALFAV